MTCVAQRRFAWLPVRIGKGRAWFRPVYRIIRDHRPVRYSLRIPAGAL